MTLEYLACLRVKKKQAVLFELFSIVRPGRGSTWYPSVVELLVKRMHSLNRKGK